MEIAAGQPSRRERVDWVGPHLAAACRDRTAVRLLPAHLQIQFASGERVVLELWEFQQNPVARRRLKWRFLKRLGGTCRGLLRERRRPPGRPRAPTRAGKEQLQLLVVNPRSKQPLLTNQWLVAEHVTAVNS